MQHSINFNLNLIDESDTFLPAPVSENTTSVDESMKMAYVGMRGEHDQRTGETASLDQRVTALEAKKMVVGSYIGNAAQNYSSLIQTFDLGFTPFAVVVFGLYPEMALPDNPGYSVELTETGFQVHNSYNTGIHSNLSNQRYTYIAFG